jgi:hypothetical protein
VDAIVWVVVVRNGAANRVFLALVEGGELGERVVEGFRGV